jgi:hypothetical protein
MLFPLRREVPPPACCRELVTVPHRRQPVHHPSFGQSYPIHPHSVHARLTDDTQPPPPLAGRPTLASPGRAPPC